MNRSLGMGIAAFLALGVGILLGRNVGRGNGSGKGQPGGGASGSSNADADKKPADLPPAYVHEGEFPTGTFDGLSAAQRFTVLKVANEKNCTCGCPNDTIAKCRTHDPTCTTAPRLLASIIADARSGLGSAQILTKMGGEGAGGASPQGSEDSGTLYQVPVAASPSRGNLQAKVTIVEFADFQCPYCVQMEPVLNELRAKYGSDLRLVFKHNPLPFHTHAVLAAEAALAAGAQGKFWEMHDLLFRTPQKLERADLENDAAQLQLDLSTFRSALDHQAHQALIDADLAQASNLGEMGTPTFFINGHKLVGLQTAESLSRLIDEQKIVAEKQLASGTPPAVMYDLIVAHGKSSNPAVPPVTSTLSRPAHGASAEPYSPTRGPETAPVTLVEWGDFQCPFTARAEATLKQIRDTYGDQVRLVWRNQPLPSHPAAIPSARTAMAASEQGKFWEVHDALFAHADRLEPEDLEKIAVAAQLDLPAWKTAVASPRVEKEIEQDAHAGALVGALGTPSFFINGLDLSGAQPFSAFQTLIDGQLKEAALLKANGTEDAQISSTLTARNVAASPIATTVSTTSALPDTTVAVELGSAPTRGPTDAPVTLVEFGDFECPFCIQGFNLLETLAERYPGKLRLAFKEDPMPFHKHAEKAAEASLAAADQGKFWPMYAQLFQHANALESADLEKYAKAAGLDVARFKQAMASGKLADRVKADATQAGSLGVAGTPTFFLNGHKLVGALPLEAFTREIDAQLARAARDGGP